MGLDRDELQVLIASLEILGTDWLDGTVAPGDHARYIVTPRGQALLELAAQRTDDGCEPSRVREELLTSFAEMIAADERSRIRAQSLAAMLIRVLKTELKKLPPRS